MDLQANIYDTSFVESFSESSSCHDSEPQNQGLKNHLAKKLSPIKESPTLTSSQLNASRKGENSLRTIENFEQRCLEAEQLYIIDFGLAKSYVDQNTGLHIPFQKKTCFVGTASFSSANAQHMMEQSRRDDLESLANVMVYLRKGKLPWLRVKITPEMSRRKKYDLVTKKKLETKITDITNGLPKELVDFYVYC